LLTNFANVAPKSCLAITRPPKQNIIISIVNFARILAIEVRVHRTLDARREWVVTRGSFSHSQFAQL
jgi:hypothetical protein